MMTLAEQNVVMASLTTDFEAASIRLFDNDVDPAPNDDFDAAVHEASFPGYSAGGALGALGSTILVDPTTGEVSIIAVDIARNFTVAGAVLPFSVTIYGYMLRNPVGGHNFFAKRFPKPVVLNNNGDFLTVNPKISLGLAGLH